MSITIAIVLGIGLFLGLTPHPASPQAIDPQSLIGEWAGTWHGKSPEMASARGSYILTIEKIDGAKVTCRVYFSHARGEFRGQPPARLEGNRLRWGGPLATELTIEGNTMRGTRTGGQIPAEINLTKK
jgi:hypothetical protein